MLDAYLRKGASLPTHNGGDTVRRVIEDAITSTLFTPLRFMGPSDVGQIISLLTGIHLPLVMLRPNLLKISESAFVAVLGASGR
jgi:hypothetical protein